MAGTRNIRFRNAYVSVFFLCCLSVFSPRQADACSSVFSLSSKTFHELANESYAKQTRFFDLEEHLLYGEELKGSNYYSVRGGVGQTIKKRHAFMTGYFQIRARILEDPELKRLFSEYDTQSAALFKEMDGVELGFSHAPVPGNNVFAGAMRDFASGRPLLYGVTIYRRRDRALDSRPERWIYNDLVSFGKLGLGIEAAIEKAIVRHGVSLNEVSRMESEVYRLLSTPAKGKFVPRTLISRPRRIAWQTMIDIQEHGLEHAIRASREFVPGFE